MHETALEEYNWDPCYHLGTSHSRLHFSSTVWHSCVWRRAISSEIFWSPLKKFFFLHPIFLLPLRSYNFLVSYFVPPSLICFLKLLTLVAFITNKKKCRDVTPHLLRGHCHSFCGLASLRVKLCCAVPFSSFGHEWGSPICWTPSGWISELLDSPWLSLYVHACTHNTHTAMHTDTDGAGDNGHCSFSGGSRWWFVSARLFYSIVGLEPAKLNTHPRAFHLPCARCI